MNSPTNPQAKRHIGQILIDQGILTEDQLRIALLEQMKSHLPVGRLLVQLGFVSEATLRDALSEKLGLQSVDLAHIIVDPAALKMLPRELARRYRMFPVALDRQAKKFLVALADTNNIVAVDQLRAHLKGDLEIELRLAGDSEIERAIEHYYGHEFSIARSISESPASRNSISRSPLRCARSWSTATMLFVSASATMNFFAWRSSATGNMR